MLLGHNLVERFFVFERDEAIALGIGLTFSPWQFDLRYGSKLREVVSKIL
jgi:hypothetical protein